MNKFLLAAFLLFSSVTAEAASRFGVCTVTCTWDAADTTMWSASSGGATGASVPGSADAVIFDAATCVGGVTCTITVNTTVTIQSITMGACTASTTGCILNFAANNNNVTLSTSFSGTGTGTRTLNLGSGTWTISGTSVPWTMSVTTGLTFNAGTSVIVLSGVATTSMSFNGGGLTYSTLTVNANASKGGLQITGANTFATFNVSAPNCIQLPNGVTTVITNAFTWTGTASSPICLTSTAPQQAATISTAAASAIVWGGIRAITLIGGGSLAATQSLDLGLNTGVTITAPTGGGGRIIGG